SQFGGAVPGAVVVGMMFLGSRIAVGRPVNRRRAGSHQSFYAGLRTSLDNVVGAVNHHLQALARLGRASGYSDGSQMKDHVNAVKVRSNIGEATNVLLR